MKIAEILASDKPFVVGTYLLKGKPENRKGELTDGKAYDRTSLLHTIGIGFPQPAASFEVKQSIDNLKAVDSKKPTAYQPKSGEKVVVFYRVHGRAFNDNVEITNQLVAIEPITD